MILYKIDSKNSSRELPQLINNFSEMVEYKNYKKANKQTKKNIGRTFIGNACLPPSCVDAGCRLVVPMSFGVITW